MHSKPLTFEERATRAAQARGWDVDAIRADPLKRSMAEGAARSAERTDAEELLRVRVQEVGIELGLKPFDSHADWRRCIETMSRRGDPLCAPERPYGRP